MVWTDRAIWYYTQSGIVPLDFARGYYHLLLLQGGDPKRWVSNPEWDAALSDKVQGASAIMRVLEGMGKVEKRSIPKYRGPGPRVEWRVKAGW